MDDRSSIHTQATDAGRFLDTGAKIYDLSDEFLVVCPKCSGRGVVTPVASDKSKISDQLFLPRRFVCMNCMHRADWAGKQIQIGAATDWYFKFPLWLKVPCCGETLWAYNSIHLETLEKYVSATLRERTKKGRNSFLSKLPKWIGLAKNRDEILRAIDKMKERLNERI